MLKAQGVKSVAVLANVLPFTKEIKNFLEPELKKAGIEIKVVHASTRPTSRT